MSDEQFQAAKAAIEKLARDVSDMRVMFIAQEIMIVALRTACGSAEVSGAVIDAARRMLPADREFRAAILEHLNTLANLPSAEVIRLKGIGPSASH